MKKSLFRLTDVLELCITYTFCFSLNLAFDYVKTVDLDSYILKSFFENFLEYQFLIVILSTFLVIVFHYQMLYRKKAEVFCKILVGDTVFHITTRYSLDCLIILVFVYLLSTLVSVYLNLSLSSNLYLALIFTVYILISTRQARKYGNIFKKGGFVMTKKISRIIGSIMFVAAIVFVIFALNHPEMSFPWSNTITYLLYGLYFVVMVIMFVAPFKKK